MTSFRGHRASTRRRTGREGLSPSRLLRRGAWAALAATALMTLPGAARSIDGPPLSDDRLTGSRQPQALSSPAPAPASVAGLEVTAPTDVVTPAPSSHGVQRATTAELEAFLLRGSDLRPGWRTLPDATGLSADALGDCLADVRDPNASPKTLEVVLQRGSDGPLVAATVAEYPSERAARRGFRAMRVAMTRCDLRVAPAHGSADVPKADEGLAIDVTLRQTGPVPARFAAIRIGARRASVLVLGPFRADLHVASVALDAMAGRLG